MCMCDLCRLADINIERMHRCRCTRRDPSHTLCHPSSDSRSLAPRNPLISARRGACCCRPNPHVFSSLLFSSLSLSLSLSLSIHLSLSFSRSRFHSFPPTMQTSLPTLPTPDTRHPIPNYVKRFRILRPDYAASLPSHSLSLSYTRVLFDCRADLSLSRAEQGFVTFINDERLLQESD